MRRLNEIFAQCSVRPRALVGRAIVFFSIQQLRGTIPGLLSCAVCRTCESARLGIGSGTEAKRRSTGGRQTSCLGSLKDSFTSSERISRWMKSSGSSQVWQRQDQQQQPRTLNHFNDVPPSFSWLRFLALLFGVGLLFAFGWVGVSSLPSS